MPPAPANLRRHLLAWDRPLLRQLVSWLARDWAGGRPLDLSTTTVIVPTRQSGRRLREALAEYASEKNQAVFPPRVHTPDSLFAVVEEAPDVASRLEALLAWTRVLRTIDLTTMPDLFPVAPPQADFAWAWRLAENFFRLQTQLNEGGLGFADVVARAGPDFLELERWRQLADLERRQADILRGFGQREPHAARRDFAQSPLVKSEAGLTRVLLLAAPDTLPLALNVLAKWSEIVPVEVGIFCGEGDLASFDEWGRPLASAWERRALILPDFEQHVQLCSTPAAEAERVAAVAARYGGEADGMVALGVADAEVLPLLEKELSRAGLAGYNPEGRARRGESLYALLTALAEFARDPSFDALAALARCPDFLAALVQRVGPEGSAAKWLRSLDELRTRYLPADFAAARRGARNFQGEELKVGLELMRELQDLLSAGSFLENAIAALRLIFRERQFDLSCEKETWAADAADAWREIIWACGRASENYPEIPPHDWWQIALGQLAASRHPEDKPAGALDLQGWLELLWEDAPHLVVAGLNDGLVPDAIVGDAFLPESLRRQLGLKTNEARFARDAYILDAVIAARRNAGRVDLLFAKTSAAGDPLRPSRLLLRCADDALPQRVAFLFRGAEATRSNLPWTRAWKLAPPRVPNPARVAVTGLRAWLACPFRFYFSHVLRMEPVDAAKSELDARDFGTLCHTALEAMAREPALRDCADEKTLREFLLTTFDRCTQERFGEQVALPLVIQLESARQRLAKAAAVQAGERAAGWVIDRAEWEFTLDVSGLQVRGKIDRIDRHEPSGNWRVLDYKTADTFMPPHKTHLRPFRLGDERLPSWRRTSLDGRELVWADLQLPLYLQALATHEPSAKASAGYFNLPKAIGETAVSLWPELTPDLLSSAKACAEGVARAIRGGEFWPPVDLPPERDPFATLFHHGAEESVAWASNPNVLPTLATDHRRGPGATNS